MKLNLGSGQDKLIDGYTNVDNKFGLSVYPLDYEDNTIDEIRASHILEHFSHRQTLQVLKEWNRVLKVGGILKVSVPDFTKLIHDFIEHPMLEGYIFGGQIDEYDFHHALFTDEKLINLLHNAGFHKFSRWESEIDDCASFTLSLNIQGIKK
jgi:predicted SAM-dependent methyltransferase